MVIGTFRDTLRERRFAFRTFTSEWATTRQALLRPLRADEDRKPGLPHVRLARQTGQNLQVAQMPAYQE
jgi:hypothetical protein